MKVLKRAVVTGLGAVSPIGNSVDEFWKNLVEGKSGAASITKMDCSQYKTRFACEVKGFDSSEYLDPKEARTMDLYSQYAMAASAQAFNDARLDGVERDPYRCGVIFASGVGGLYTLQEEIVKYANSGYKPRFSPFMIPKMIANIAAGLISIKFDFRGANYGVVSACASSSHALIDALNLIRLGKADVVIAGGSEASINAVGLGGFSALRAISERNDDPATASRPFDKDRDGFVLGEGSAALVIESLEHAQARNARIYAELTGGGMTADAYHSTLPQPEGRSVYKSMALALEDAEVKPEQIDYINLHATSTPAGDVPEMLAVQKLFADSIDKLHVSGTKSMTGHLLGAAGALEATATVLAICNNTVPPTINTQNVDDAIDSRVNLTLGKAVEKEVNMAMSNTFGFGGQNASLVFSKYR
ncbi:MAG: beta-ketoacyl-ACP synthase II [Chitinispirillaceae bacterium]